MSFGVEIDVPSIFLMRIGLPPSIIRSALDVPVIPSILILAVVPLKVKATPVLGQVSCVVAGLTLPTNR